MKKLTTIAGAAVLFTFTVLPILATGNNCSNSTTGPFSTDYCTVNNTSNVTVNNVNDAKIINHVTARANSGNNTASYNTLGGSIVTGNATLNTTVSSVANVNTTTIAGSPGAVGNSGVNEITGPYSDNRIDINNRQRIDVYNSNTASVYNNINATANSGENAADFNTGPASVTTGNARLGVTLVNHVNDSATGISMGPGGGPASMSNGSGGNFGSNSTTGPFSTDYVSINNTTDVAVNNVNDLKLINLLRTFANAGRNSASFNTLGGMVDAGNAWSDVFVENQGNINTTTIETEMASMSLAGNGGNQAVTGPYSDNRVDLLNNQNVVVDNWNNKCQSHNADRLGGHHRGPRVWGDWEDVDEDSVDDLHKKECKPDNLGVFNFDDDEANTGGNAADFNTGLGSAVSGMAELWKSILTHLNDNLVVIQL